MNLELLKHAKEYIEQMANGINPLTKETIPENELLNNIRISRCLFYVNDVLGKVLMNGGIYNKKIKKTPFNLSREILNKYEYTNEDLPISKIVNKINDLNPNKEMETLKVSIILKWLIINGILEEIIVNDKKRKKPTELGKSIGIYIERRNSIHGEYDILMYKKEAQEFIIDNFESLLDFIKE